MLHCSLLLYVQTVPLIESEIFISNFKFLIIQVSYLLCLMHNAYNENDKQTIKTMTYKKKHLYPSDCHELNFRTAMGVYIYALWVEESLYNRLFIDLYKSVAYQAVSTILYIG